MTQEYKAKDGIMKKLVLIMLVVTLMSGCKSMDMAAFTRDKTYAVVVVGVNPEHKVFSYKGPKVRYIDPDKLIPKNKDTSRYADKMAAEFVKGLKKHSPVNIISGKRVTGRSVYRQFKSIDKSRLTKRHEATHDYHMYWLDDYKRMPELARKLGVDGVLMAYLEAGSNYRGTYKPAMEIYLEGYSASGKRVLRYNLRYTSDDSDSQVKFIRDASHFRLLNESIANKHAYLAGVDSAKRVWGKIK